MSNEQISTVAIIVLLIIGMMSLIRICRPFDWLRALVCIAMGVGIAICLLFFKKIFAIAAINMVMLNMIIVYAVGLFVLMCRIVGTVIEYIEGHSRRFRKLLKG